MPHTPPEITTLLLDWRDGDGAAGEQLLEVVYQELRRLAAHYLQRERPDHTLEPTALVHELYLRLFAGEQIKWQNRAHFFAVAAQQLRRILIDHARTRQADKRGGQQLTLSLAGVEGWAGRRDEDLLALNDALHRLSELDKRAGQVVELRFFGGLQEKEAAEVLNISVSTLKRDWEFARAWLFSRLAKSTGLS